jgi:hypothetical protein
MISLSDQRRREQSVNGVFVFMRQRRLDLNDLTELGGAELKSANPTIRAKANHVEKTWALMAQLSLRFSDLAHTTAPVA